MADYPIDLPPGLRSDDTTYAASPGWADGSNMRFRLGRPQTIGGWESIFSTLLTGVCRAVLVWTDNSPAQNIAFGTHSALQLYQGGSFVDITPFGPASLLGSNPLTTATGTPTVTVAHPAHGRTTGDQVLIANAAAVGGITPNGTFSVTVVDANTYTFAFGSNATSTATGGGSSVVEVPQVALPAGNVDGTGTSGYGTGAYGVGGWGQPSAADYFPRTWSLAAWGQKLLASPRNGALYEWSNVLANRAVAVPTAPTRITQMLVTPQRQVFALGCTQEVGGAWNPLCLRHSSIGDETSWTTDLTTGSTAREYVLPGGGRIVGGKVVGRYLLVWTTQSLFLGTYVGDVTQVWSFDKVGDRCGLAAPNAAAVLGGVAYWMTPDRQFRSYSLGGAPQPLACPIRADFAENLAASQADKITATTIAEFGEVRWDYPDARDGSPGTEVSRYLAAAVEGPDAGAWYRGKTVNGVAPARSAMFDAGPGLYPVGVTPGGNVYWHEVGASADGQALAWYITSADLFLDENSAILVREVWPDISSDQIGPVSLTVAGRQHQKAPLEIFGPYVIAPSQELIDFKASGRLFNVTWSGYSLPSYARLGRPVFDGKPRGRRG